MRRPTYLILHGYQGSGPGHWQTWLAGRLRAGEATVAYPDLPDADSPTLDSWRGALTRELDVLDDRPIVLCHSLACILWLHHAANGGASAERVLLVAPPSQAGVPEVLKGFFPVPLPRLENTRIVCSDDDPFCPEGAQTVYAPLGVPVDLIPGGGHLNPDAGLGPWPEVEAWAREGVQPVSASTS